MTAKADKQQAQVGDVPVSCRPLEMVHRSTLAYRCRLK